MTVILAGGMPWTDFFGAQLKWVQKQTDSGYPKNWSRSSGLSSSVLEQPINLNDVVKIAESMQLKGEITINLPVKKTDVFTVSNRSFLLRNQQVIHIDQYSGAIIKHLMWRDVGILMELRQVAMRFHQGEYGIINWLFVLVVIVFFTLTTTASLISYLIRKPSGRWGVPKVPATFNVDFGLMAVITLSGIVFPLFGMSVLVIIAVEGVARVIA